MNSLQKILKKFIINKPKEKKMRKMQSKSGKTTVKVTRHITLVNKWEYYIVDDDEMQFEKNSDIQFAYVIGWHPEFGTVSLEELEPYIITDTKNLNEAYPAPNWRWIDE